MYATGQLLSVLAEAAQKRVVVLGDLYLERQVTGSVRGMSPEEPVPLLEVEEHRLAPGAAGNIAAGIVALGASARVLGVVGDDPEAELLLETYRQAGIDADAVLRKADTPTLTRTRITARDGRGGTRSLLRLDSPPPADVEGETEARLMQGLEDLLSEADAVVVVEAPSGVTTPKMINAAQRAARQRGAFLVGDVFGQPRTLRGYDVVLPNQREALEFMGVRGDDDANLDSVGPRLVTEYDNSAAAITRGARGITLFTKEGREDVPTVEREVFDVTGAGDTVTAAFATALMGGATLRQAAELANLAALVAVQRAGLAVVTAEDVRHTITEVAIMSRGGKLRTLPELVEIVATAKAQGKRVVFTNGCFDLIHPGHVTYLQQARNLGDMLIVALNSDSSVRSLKGPSRPILNQDERVMILSALESVTWITVFDEQRVTGILSTLQPTVWAKGGDYTLETLDQSERAAVEAYGGEIALLPPVQGISTTEIVARIEEAKARAREGK